MSQQVRAEHRVSQRPGGGAEPGAFVREAESILSRARSAGGSAAEAFPAASMMDEARLGRELVELAPLATDLAALVLAESRRRQSAAEAKHEQTLARLVASPSSQLLTLTLTDRALRSSIPLTSLAAVREVLATTNSAALSLFDRLGLFALRTWGPLMPGLAMRSVLGRLRAEAAPFVLDASEPALTERLASRKAEGFHINLNYLGEEVTSEVEAARRLELYLELARRDDIDALSVKLSALSSRLDPWAAPQLVPTLAKRLEPVLRELARRNRLLYFDMEAHRDLEPTLQIVERLSQMPALLGARIGVALQAYLPESSEAAERLLQLSLARVEAGGAPLRLRLVKGANLAAESIESSLAGLPLPIFPDKHLVDAHYKQLLLRLLGPARSGQILLGLASHNLFDLSLALLAAERSAARTSLQLEMLEGMAGSTGRVLSELHGPLLLYSPCVAPESFPAALSYLVRRLDENTSPENFLSNAVGMQPGDDGFVRERERFIEACRIAQGPLPASYRATARSAEAPTLRGAFQNASDTDFTQADVRSALERTLTETRQSHFEVGPLLADANDFNEPTERVELPGFDPSRPDVVPYRTRLAGPMTIRSALDQLAEAAPLVAGVSADERASWLERAADELERERHFLSSLLVLDAGKRVREADLEVAEAIDFARYYARSYREGAEALELEPRGPTVVVPPWNFALAIPLGGCFAALMAGNPVLLKPAPETPLVAWAAVELCHRAGIPRAALQFLPCSNRHATALIEDPRVRVVVLTGSTSTARLFLRKRPDLHLLAETGGKNGLYLSALSDREQAVSIILRSAFGHAGQKCSALSVLVLDDELMRDASFRRLLAESTEGLVVGSAWEPESFVTPLIEPPRGPLARLLERAEEWQWLVRPRLAMENPRLLSPGIAWDVPRGSFAQRTEFFGPIVSVLGARHLDDGLSILNDTEYGLTAGFVGLSVSEQRRFLAGMNAGNLYVNRPITGAVVGRQPFGGRKQSQFGPGAKAGGPDYVLGFCHVRSRRRALPVGRDVVGTSVRGEVNFLRYQPRELVLLVCLDAGDEEVELCLAAARHVGARLQVVRIDDAPAWAGLEDREALRVRLVGTPSAEVLQRAGVLGWTLLADPVNRDSALEVRHYLDEQSVSIAYHRHGNTRLEPALRPMTD